MKTILAVVFALLIGLPICLGLPKAGDSIQQQIVSKEREELDALKSGDLGAFAALLADEAVFLNPHGPSTKSEVVKHIADFKLLGYTMEDIRFVPVASKTGLIVYKLKQRAAANEKEFASTAHISALWTERDGKWVCLFSQETPAK